MHVTAEWSTCLLCLIASKASRHSSKSQPANPARHFYPSLLPKRTVHIRAKVNQSFTIINYCFLRIGWLHIETKQILLRLLGQMSCALSSYSYNSGHWKLTAAELHVLHREANCRLSVEISYSGHRGPKEAGYNSSNLAASCEKVPNDLSRCHTKRRMGAYTKRRMGVRTMRPSCFWYDNDSGL